MARRLVTVGDDLVLHSSVTVPVAQVTGGQSAAGLDAAAAALVADAESDTAVTLSSTFGRGVSVTAYGAVGDGITDDAAAITAAITAAGAGGAVYFPAPSSSYLLASAVTVTLNGVRLWGERGTLVKAGEHRTFVVTGDDVTIDGLTLERETTQPNEADTTNLRANVAVGGERFTSRDVDYVNANMACLYLAHASCDGARILGGTMTNASTKRNASGIYVAPGSTGNNNIMVDGVDVTGGGCPDGILIYDASDCTVRNCTVQHMRKIETVTLTGWEVVSGDVYRTLDRPGDSTMIVKKDGTQLTDGGSTTTPVLNEWGLSGGYVYINVGADPAGFTITSDMPSGYGITFYWSETGYSGMNRNRVESNRVTDCDGIGIYMQFQNTPTSCRNNSTANNILKDVCLEGIQHTSLAFGGIGWGGGFDCVSVGDQIHIAGSSGKAAPGVRMQNSSSGRLVGVAASGCFGPGFDIASANWTLNGCVANGNATSGFRVYSGVNGNAWRGIQLIGCRADDNTIRGVDVEVTTSGSTAQVHVVGGTFTGNAQQGVNFVRATDSKVVGAAFHNNGAGSFPAVHVRSNSARCIVDDVTITGTSTNLKGLTVDNTVTDAVIGRVIFLSGGGGTPAPLALSVVARESGVSDNAAGYFGAGDPEGAVTAAVGSQYRRTDGGTGTTLYVKESGTGNTGWVAK